MLVTETLQLLPFLAGFATDDLDQVIAELDPAPAHVLVRAHALGIRYERDHDPVTLSAALDLFEACTYEGPERGVVGRSLVIRQLQAGLLGEEYDEDRIRGLIDVSGDDPEVAGSSTYLHAMTDALAAYTDDPRYDRTEAATHLAELAGTVPADSEYARLVPTLRMVLAVRRGQDGNYTDATAATTAAAAYARAMLARDDLGTGQRLHAEALLAGAEGMAAAQDGELDRAASALLAMTELVDRMPPADPATVAMHNLLAGAAGTTHEFDGAHPGLSASERAWRLYLSAVAVLRPALESRNAAELGHGVMILREAADIAPADYPHRAMILSMLGRVLCAQYQLGAGRPALDEALRRLTDAQQATAHPGHPLWASTASAYSFALRLADRRTDGRSWGQRALSGHAWGLLLQAGTPDAVTSARHAGDDAVQVARWCLADGDITAAAAALEAGRCLITYAATETRDIPARMRDLGRPDLVSRWHHDTDEPGLRADVLTALTGEAVTEAALPEVLDPPTAEEIGRALTELHADALVYLLPGDEHGPGVAVLVPASGHPSHLALPRLHAADVVQQHIRRLADAASSPAATSSGPASSGPASSGPASSGPASSGPASSGPGAGGPATSTASMSGADAAAGSASGAGPSALDRLCTWAWTAATGPLLAEISGWPLDHAPRIVLVPIGSLAAVPWHAARDTDGTRAVERATFSYATSARLMGRKAGRDPDAWVLIADDPAGDAHAESLSHIYPGAQVLAGPAVTTQALSDWLLAGGGDVLHLACPGIVQDSPDGTHLSLAAGERLTARDILSTAGTSAIGVVGLAACTTAVAGAAYDEAFSLNTAFLTAGARTVLGSLWTAPADATAVLMFMAHHFLRTEGRRPADALNQAQRWLLDPQRQAPSSMPADLTARLSALDPTDVATWAPFTHHGR
ncbi:CHAT domain-containing protein [Micromonosporaceae bacterium Da 78-11]